MSIKTGLFPNSWLAGATVGLCSSESVGEQGWGSGESARLPPMCPGFDSRTRRHMWVEFVVGSRLAPRVFLRVLRFSSLLKAQHFKIPIRSGIRGPRVYQFKTVVCHPR